MSPRSNVSAAVRARQKRSAGQGVAILADITTTDGTVLNWADRAGVFPSSLSNGTRIQTAGGTNVLKYFYNAGAGLTGVSYRVRVIVKNQGAVKVQLNTNQGAQTAIITPGSVIAFDRTVVGNGVGQLHIHFEALNAGDSLDVVAYSPSILRLSDNTELVPNNASTFQTATWTQYQGAVATITQAVANPGTVYSAWLKSAGDFQSSRDTKTDAGNLVIQNLSGNTIERDAAKLVKAHEFEGALAVVRFWDTIEDAILDQYLGTKTEIEPDNEQISFRMVQLFDPNLTDIADDVYSETCTLLFKSVRCGSTSLNATCAKRFSVCTAVERFRGIPSVPPGHTQISTLVAISNATGGGGGGPERPQPPQRRGL
jgi:hypothetical protein